MNFIKDHGTWVLYTPATIPPDAPAGTVFSRRVSDGVDWYDYVNSPTSFGKTTLKINVFVEDGITVVKRAFRDKNMAWQMNMQIIELDDGRVDEGPIWDYIGKQYNPATHTISEIPPKVTPVTIPTSASKLGLKRALAELGLWVTARAMIAANPDTQEEWDLAIEIKRTDILTQGLITAMALTSVQVDNILIRAKELTA
jgi:hypothetical protein